MPICLPAVETWSSAGRLESSRNRTFTPPAVLPRSSPVEGEIRGSFPLAHPCCSRGAKPGSVSATGAAQPLLGASRSQKEGTCDNSESHSRQARVPSLREIIRLLCAK